MKKILIADDDPDITMLLASRLNANGYQVVTTSDCSMTIKKAYIEKPDLIILDIRMPSTSGINVYESLKMFNATENIPVIFITAYPSDNIRKQVAEMGADDFIAKPFKTEELLPKVKRILNESPL